MFSHNLLPAPTSIDIVVISHDHYDHTGGLEKFLSIHPHVQVYMPASFPADFKEKIKRQGSQLTEAESPMEICEGIYSTGELEGTIIEQALLVKDQDGFIIVTGCAHPGIIDIAEKAKTILDGEISLIVGGFHLLEDGEKSIRNIGDSLKKLGVEKIAPCHCCGKEAFSCLKEEYGQNYITVGVGSKL